MSALRPRTPQEERLHLLQVLDALHINIDAFNQGRPAGWMAVSAQLFILLCDKNKHNNWTVLVERVIPDFSLRPLRNDLSNKVGKYLFYLPKISFDVQRMQLELFDFDEPKITLHQWLSQVIVIGTVSDAGVPISIDTLVRTTRDQAGGAHYDPNIQEDLQAAQSFIFVEGRAHLPFFSKALVAIGDYVVKEVQCALEPPPQSYGLALARSRLAED